MLKCTTAFMTYVQGRMITLQQKLKLCSFKHNCCKHNSNLNKQRQIGRKIRDGEYNIYSQTPIRCHCSPQFVVPHAALVLHSLVSCFFTLKPLANLRHFLIFCPSFAVQPLFNGCAFRRCRDCTNTL
jgi:hypothetical protein